MTPVMCVVRICADDIFVNGFSIEDKLTGSYREWKYVVQYGETDFNFVSRLMEQEGAYLFPAAGAVATIRWYWQTTATARCPTGPAPFRFTAATALRTSTTKIFDGQKKEDIASGNFAADDYDFEKPKAILDTMQQMPAGHSEDSREQYEWPGGYTEFSDGDNYARIRIEQQKAQRRLPKEGTPATSPPATSSPSANTHARTRTRRTECAAHYRFEENAAAMGQEARVQPSAGASIAARPTVSASPSYPKAPLSAANASPQSPTPVSPQPVVISPAGEEIYTTSTVKSAQFHWDRYGKFDENSSCWIRRLPFCRPLAGSLWRATCRDGRNLTDCSKISRIPLLR